MVGTTALLARLAVIKFRKGGIGKPSAPPASAKSGHALAAAAVAKPAPAVAAAAAPAAAASTASHSVLVSTAFYNVCTY